MYSSLRPVVPVHSLVPGLVLLLDACQPATPSPAGRPAEGAAARDDVGVTVLDGSAYDGTFGSMLTPLGDVNGDGYDDVIVGSPCCWYDQLGFSGAYFYQGSANGLSSLPDAVLSLGDVAAVAGAGDVNGDDYDDAILAWQADHAGYRNGQASVFHGSESGISTTADLTLTPDTGPVFVGSVSGAGDVNGDGYADVILGAGEAAYLYQGSATGVVSVPSALLAGDGSSESFGSSVAGVGDINGDGFSDVLVGAYQYLEENGGRVYVFTGSSQGLSTTTTTVLHGDASVYGFGVGLGPAGDVNGDGYADVYVRSIEEAPVSVFLGSTTGLSTPPLHVLADLPGAALSAAGDVDADGFDDLIVGVPGTSVGGAFLLRGSDVGPSDLDRLGVAMGAPWLGGTVSGAGDVNGDGFDDLMIGQARDSAPTDGAKRVFVLHGPLAVDGTLDADGDGAFAWWDCDDDDATIFPGATEAVADGIDQDCDLVDLCYVDADEDGFRTEDTVPGIGMTCDGPGEAVSTDGTDCDDGDADVFPGALDLADDRVDQDCDGVDSSPDEAIVGCGCSSGGTQAWIGWVVVLSVARPRRTPPTTTHSTMYTT